MIYLNSAMEKLLLNENDKKEALETGMIIREVVHLLQYDKNAFDCIIFDENGKLEESKINFDRILKLVGDWTGYEISCNELRYFKSELPPDQFLCFADGLNSALSQKYSGRKFGIVISVDNEIIDLRFHTYREKEGLWLDKDLNKYDNPILYYI